MNEPRHCLDGWQSLSQSVSFLQTRRRFILTHQLTTRTTVSGLPVERVTSVINACWFSVLHFHSTLWFLLEFAMAGRAGFILYLMRLRLMGTITLLICFPYWWRTHSSYCSRISCFNKTAH